MTIFEQKQDNAPEKKEAEEVINLVKSLYRQITMTHGIIFRKIWSSKNPQLVIDEIGYEDAVKLFELSAQLQALLKTADPSYEPLVPNRPIEFTKDEIIVGEIIEKKEEE